MIMSDAAGLTYPQYLVMMVLWEKDHQPVNDIAKRLLLETNTATPLLQRMEKSGLVVRHKGSQDGRQMIVSLTPRGKGLEETLADIPERIGGAVLCDCINEKTVPELFRVLDGLISKLRGVTSCQSTPLP